MTKQKPANVTKHKIYKINGTKKINQQTSDQVTRHKSYRRDNIISPTPSYYLTQIR